MEGEGLVGACNFEWKDSNLVNYRNIFAMEIDTVEIKGVDGIQNMRTKVLRKRPLLQKWLRYHHQEGAE